MSLLGNDSVFIWWGAWAAAMLAAGIWNLYRYYTSRRIHGVYLYLGIGFVLMWVALSGFSHVRTGLTQELNMAITIFARGVTGPALLCFVLASDAYWCELNGRQHFVARVYEQAMRWWQRHTRHVENDGRILDA